MRREMELVVANQTLQAKAQVVLSAASERVQGAAVEGVGRGQPDPSSMRRSGLGMRASVLKRLVEAPISLARVKRGLSIHVHTLKRSEP
jgi:hypothetical protein